jgi:glucokinase
MKICCDAGGSKARFALLDANYGVQRLLKYSVTGFPNGEDGFTVAFAKFLEDISDTFPIKKPIDCIISAAGTINDGRVVFTNSDWVIDTAHIAAEFHEILENADNVHLLNDFEALAYGLINITEDDVNTLYNREGVGGTKIVCGPGTGLGLSALHKYGSNKFECAAISTEAGHQSFSPETPLEQEIYEYFMQPFVSYEQILSGFGMTTLYNFFSEQGGTPNVNELSPVEVMSQHALVTVAARRTLEAFAAILGSFCGNMALALGAREGIYLWGGILKEYPDLFLRRNFLQRFQNRGRKTDYVAEIPIHRIISDEVALKGCAMYGDIQAQRR